MKHQLHQQPLPDVLGRADQSYAMSAAHQHPPQTQTENFGFIPQLLRRVYADWFDCGYRFARSSGTLRLREAELERLEHDAALAVEGMGAEPYDPARNPHDRLQQDEFDQLLKQREDYRYGVLSAQADAARQQRRRADLQTVAVKPRAPRLFIVLAAVLLGLSVVLTLEGYFFEQVEDELYRWLAAGFIALMQGAFLCASCFSGRSGFGVSNKLSRLLLGGVVLQAAALALVRYVNAQSEPARWFALVLFVFELGVSLAVEAQAEGYRQSWQNYQQHQAELLRAESAQSEALERLGQWSRRLTAVELQIAGHIRQVNERALCHGRLDALKNVARKAIRNGYLNGVAENYRYVFGPAREAA